MNAQHPIYSVNHAVRDLVESGYAALLVPLRASVRIVGLSSPCGRLLPGARRASEGRHETELQTQTPSREKGEMNLREAKLRQKLYKMVAAATFVAVLGVQAAFGQAAAQKTWKDGEYELYKPVEADTNPATKLPKLDAWKAKFPVTDFETERQANYLATYQALKKGPEIYATAKEILAKDSENLPALIAATFSISLFPAPSTADMATTDQAATTLIANGDKIFAADKKPQGVTDDQWNKTKKDIQDGAQGILAFTATTRKEWDKSEAEFTKVVNLQPTNVQANYSIATAQMNQFKADQKKTDKFMYALFHLARAANYSGPGALPEANRKPVQAYFEKQYVNFHGDKTDIEKVLPVAVANSLPPADFKIKSVVEMQAEKDAAAADAAKNDPAGAMWKQIKDALVADGGQAYFDSSIKGAALPGGANGVKQFKGKLVSATPETNPKELVLDISGDGKVGEVMLKFETALRGKMDVGTIIGFEGVASGFTKDPFHVTFDTERAKISGWTASGPAPVAQKKAGPAARPPVKKK